LAWLAGGVPRDKGGASATQGRQPLPGPAGDNRLWGGQLLADQNFRSAWGNDRRQPQRSGDMAHGRAGGSGSPGRRAAIGYPGTPPLGRHPSRVTTYSDSKRQRQTFPRDFFSSGFLSA